MNARIVLANAFMALAMISSSKASAQECSRLMKPSVCNSTAGCIWLRGSCTNRRLHNMETQDFVLSDTLPFGGIETVEVEGEDPFDIDVPVSDGVGCDSDHKQCESYSEVTP